MFTKHGSAFQGWLMEILDIIIEVILIQGNTHYYTKITFKFNKKFSGYVWFQLIF